MVFKDEIQFSVNNEIYGFSLLPFGIKMLHPYSKENKKTLSTYRKQWNKEEKLKNIELLFKTLENANKKIQLNNYICIYRFPKKEVEFLR